MMRNRRHPLEFVAWALLIVVGLATGVAVQRLWAYRAELERLADRLTLEGAPESTLIFDQNNNLVSALFEEHRIPVRLEEMSPHLINALLVTEDRRFYDHDGIDIRRIAMAWFENARAGEIVQGGSTITQQLVRSILLDRRQVYSRKIKEVILARRLEERYAKRAILEAYLNRVYFGDGYYGAEAASIGYFGKSAANLDPAEAATLAGLIKGPSLYSPTKNADLARERRDWVLGEMKAEGMLSDQEFQAAVSVPVNALLARGDKTGVQDPRHMRGMEYFRDAVTRELIDKFGTEAVYTGGLRVYTTLDPRLQRIAEETIESRLKRMPRGGREPLQGALVAIDPRTGHVKAVVGGRDFDESQYNRAIDAKRQPGSAFKPFIFALALESGFSPRTQLENLDQPIPTHKGPWLPGGEHEVNSITLRDAMVVSSNRAAAHLMQQVGVDRTINFVQRFGVTSQLPAVPAAALGTGEMTLLELTSAYGVFANRGVWHAPTMIRRVVDKYGREVYRGELVERTVISEATAYMMASMMSDVVNHGTATTARSTGFRLQAAGKTGTSQDYSDAWFVGFTPQLVAGVWFGYDKPRPIMNRGFASVVAVPAWARFMTMALKGMKDEWYDMPGSLVKVKICRISGMLATERCTQPVTEAPPYDPNNPNVMAATAPVTRAGGVFEDVRPYDRIPPPCPLTHDGGDARHAYYDSLSTSSTEPVTMPALPPVSVDPAMEIPEPPVQRPAPLPPFMTERAPTLMQTSAPAAAPTTPVETPAASSIVTTPPSAPPVTKPAEPKPAEPKPVEPKPTPESPENPIIPGGKVEKPATPPTPEQEAPANPIIPGTKVEKPKAPPTPPPTTTPPTTTRPPQL